MSVTVAIDAMGGDRAPGEIVDGAVQASEQLDVRVLLVGREEVVGPLLPGTAGSVEVVSATEVVGMSDAPTSVRSKKDSSIVVCAQLVRDGKADALVSAGNTGATMAASLLRIGRIKGVARPAIAAPIPVPGHRPQILVDAGATVDCSPEVARAVRGDGTRVRPHSTGHRRAAPRPAVERRRSGQGRRRAQARVRAARRTCPGFVGNVEGRDFMRPGIDVIVTDGFTGNVALKTIEGAIRGTASLVYGVLEIPELRGRGAGGDAAPAGGGQGRRSRLRRGRGAARREGRVRRRSRLVERDRDRRRRCARRSSASKPESSSG